MTKRHQNYQRKTQILLLFCVHVGYTLSHDSLCCFPALGQRTVTHVDVTAVTGQVISGFSVVTSHNDDCFFFYCALVFLQIFSLPRCLSFLVSLTLAAIVAPKHTMLLLRHWLATRHMTGVSADQILGKRGNFFHQDGRKKTGL